ncbi:hypothetical protein HBA55_34780 [Pseudomaricurvus alkylphenolicus]|uniref:hypothetical protein n=1 Tax=Pseudomaricurvus alkylphenolicus TaxID=1306991 RepID=UPI0014242005|nr:hypothetical protein [Pseudomaricurvus alkylphenolicus]NIB44798.1 hypothetical protein [Pseudomaricurvus alkylphenolicus]
MSIEKFIECAQIHADMNYGDPKSVSKANLAAETMADIAKQLITDNCMDEAQSILDHEVAGQWGAFLLVDISGENQELQQRCIAKIRAIAEGDGPEAFGAQVWLRERNLGFK